MPKRRSHYDKAPWWKVSVGGAPMWLIVGVGAFLLVIVVPALIIR